MTALLGRAVHVTVPATSANLGPGFDSLGLALALHDELEVRVREQPGATVDVRGIGEGEVPTDASNLIVRSIAHAFAWAGQPLPGLDLVAHNRILHGRGLGSSGAAIVSGVMAAKGLLEGVVELSANDLLRIATELEGHPDNVAPALFGGLTIAWTGPEGPGHTKLNVHPGVSPLVCSPGYAVSTELARSLQPLTVPHADAAFNVSRSALLIAALTQSPHLLHAATEDRLHQGYRASAMPETARLVLALREQGHAAVVSGAGPSLLVLCSSPAERLAAAAIVEEESDTPWQKLMPAVDVKGATVIAHRVDPDSPESSPVSRSAAVQGPR
jgi:homoserine kinase